jgi:hypothetical protein
MPWEPQPNPARAELIPQSRPDLVERPAT